MSGWDDRETGMVAIVLLVLGGMVASIYGANVEMVSVGIAAIAAFVTGAKKG